ncbi:5'/3'-nucleotidase SurE [Synechococcus sp. PCC 7336]|uniref:5'/3'-nucleotidase SurE n=1 Tax=Synechococcus sp. PCC 7336 TaxID=195250 RepID=UPI000347A167|nr:5'/3'-nucleotidase SurE [Synechococcus sp. PCC 7336]
MKLLISNDDGIYSLGVVYLANTLALAGHSVTVVCPDRERSATGHALTLHKPLRVERVVAPYDSEIAAWACSGTPSDCIKLGLDELLDEGPDWVISGINRGGNLGSDVLYSGTVSAAMEGLMAGVNSMAVSLNSSSATDFEPAASFVRDWLDKPQSSGIGPPILLNVNVPALPATDICGVVLAPLGMRHYSETFEQRVDPRGKIYYWIAGEALDTQAASDTDIVAIQDNYITVTPLHFNLTAYGQFDAVQQWGLPLYSSGSTDSK